MKRFSLKVGMSVVALALGTSMYGVGCGGPADETASEKAALTQAQQDILGFERPHLWSDPSGPVSTTSPDRTEGQKSLKVKPKGYVPYVSKPLPSLGPVGSTVLYDLKLPTEQANRYWFGASQMFVSIPSQNVYNAYVGQVELTGKPLNQWFTMSFGLPASLVTTLGTKTYSDLTFTIVLNVPSNATGTYLIDNVRFSAPNGGTGGAGGGATGGAGTGGANTGGAGTGGAATGGANTGGANTGGAATGGRGTGGANTGGANTGGTATGGRGTGGANTGGANTGGANTGGANTGGANTGGANTGGANTGGANTGGANTGGAATGGRGTGGANTGGANTGGANTGGANTGGAATGGRGTGGANTGGAGTGGAGTGGAGTGGAGTGGAPSCVPTHCAGPVCEQCTTDNCIPSTDGCDQIADPADRKLCEDVYACFTNPVNACVVQGDPLKCWCGTNPTTCVTSNAAPTKANGPCLDIILAAAKMDPAAYDAATIKGRFVNTDFPLGRAVNLTSCRGSFCSGECSVP